MFNCGGGGGGACGSDDVAADADDDVSTLATGGSPFPSIIVTAMEAYRSAFSKALDCSFCCWMRRSALLTCTSLAAKRCQMFVLWCKVQAE